MSRAADRTVLGLVGVLLVALGALALVAAGDEGRFDGPAVLLDRATRSVDERPAVWFAVFGVVAAVMVVVGWRSLRRALARPRRPGPIELSEGPRGRTRLEPAAIERAVRADLRHVAGIRTGRVTLRSTGPRPRLRVQLTLDPTLADVAAVRAAAEAAYRRLVTCLALEGVRADLVVRVGRRSTVSRVR